MPRARDGAQQFIVEGEVTGFPPSSVGCCDLDVAVALLLRERGHVHLQGTGSVV